MRDKVNMETATFAGGCFWCLEAPFRRLNGVLDVVSGYTGGHVVSPDYKQVCNGTTGHAEVIRIDYDPSRIGFRDLLKVFFVLHDPTTLNRQGNDIGTQYRSAIFFHDDGQRDAALEVIEALTKAGEWGAPVVTELSPVQEFYPAEPYHQAYFDKNPYQPYCQAVIGPKLEKLKAYFPEYLNKKAS